MVNIKKMYGNINELAFVKFDAKYMDLINGFKTYVKDKKEYLLDDAHKAQTMFISTTYLIFDKSDFDKNKDQYNLLTLLGYITILNDSINLDSDLKKYFSTKGINYKSLPAIKIGRLCVDERYERRNIGKIAIFWCIFGVCKLNQKISCRFINVDVDRGDDPKNDPIRFYKKLDFSILKNKKKKKTTPLYLDLFPLLIEFEKLKNQ